jgi:hypothetical protein
LPEGPDPEGRVNQYVAKAERVRVVLGSAITIGELLMWENTDSLCFLYENELGQRTLESFPDTQAFIQWMDGRIGGGHNIHRG